MCQGLGTAVHLDVGGLLVIQIDRCKLGDSVLWCLQGHVSVNLSSNRVISVPSSSDIGEGVDSHSVEKADRNLTTIAYAKLEQTHYLVKSGALGGGSSDDWVVWVVLVETHVASGRVISRLPDIGSMEFDANHVGYDRPQ